MSKYHISATLAMLLACSTGLAEVGKAVLRVEAEGKNLLAPAGWQAAKRATRQGEVFVCDNGQDGQLQSGFAQTVTLNQTEPRPIVATAWSKAEDVGGSRDSDYSLYLDIVYADGEPLWGQIASYRTGTHDWQKAEVKIFPAKPVKTVSANLLLRRHSGRAMFKEPKLVQAEARGGIEWFDGLPVASRGARKAEFLLRDVAAGSDFQRLDGEALGVRIKADVRNEAGVTRVYGEIRDTSRSDRALTLAFVRPVEGGGWEWLAGPRQRIATSTGREYADLARCAAGANGTMSLYPFAAVASGKQGHGIGLDMDKPAVFRVGYNGGSRELYIALDVALTKEKPSAEFSFSLFDFDGEQGFRGAVDRYQRMYPEHFRCRTPSQGIWMPFYRISQVQGWEDFGFKFKEGNDETAWDDAHGILTFRYTEPMTWWMRMPKEMPRTLDAAAAQAKQLAAGGDRSAAALLTSGFHDESGRLVARFRNEPWCNGAVWSINSSPGVAGDVTDFKNKWNRELIDRLYGKNAKGELDGEYVDSSEGYVTDELDFRREHFAAAQMPLTFSAEDYKPAVYRGLIAYEYVRALAEVLHRGNKLTMANSTPYRLCWLAPYLDVMGTETDWKPGGRWRPMSDGELMYRRVLCGPKPYCFLMNTNFENWTHDDSEKFMRRCLAYGMFPGFFSHNAAEGHYFSQPKLYNRDRDLFKKYVPLCKRVAEAGWRPISGASSGDQRVYVERFGEKYLTIFNDSAGRKRATITLQKKVVGRCEELVAGREIDVKDGSFEVELEAEGVAVVELP